MSTMTPVIEKQTNTVTKLGKLWKCLVHNDDVNSMDHVTHALMEVFKFNPTEAVEIMLEAHESGVALCKIETKELAELHQQQLQALSLTATIEPE